MQDKIALGSDHGGFELKEIIKNSLRARESPMKTTAATASSQWIIPILPLQWQKLWQQASILLVSWSVGQALA